MTQTHKLVAGVVVAIVLIVGGYFALKSEEGMEMGDMQAREQGEMAIPNEAVATPTGMPESGKKMAFSQFIKQGGSYSCTVNQTVENSDMKGKIYISGDMVRGEYSIVADGMNMDSNMIVRDGYTYTWSSMMAGMGFKTKVDSNTTSDQVGTTGTSGSYAWNAEQIGDYDCKPWVVDAKMFELPSGVTFSDPQSMTMPNMPLEVQ